MFPRVRSTSRLNPVSAYLIVFLGFSRGCCLEISLDDSMSGLPVDGVHPAEVQIHELSGELAADLSLAGSYQVETQLMVPNMASVAVRGSIRLPSCELPHSSWKISKACEK